MHLLTHTEKSIFLSPSHRSNNKLYTLTHPIPMCNNHNFLSASVTDHVNYNDPIQSPPYKKVNNQYNFSIDVMQS